MLYEFYSVRKVAKILMVDPSSLHSFGARRGVFRPGDRVLPRRYKPLLEKLDLVEGVNMKDKLLGLHARHKGWDGAALNLGVDPALFRSFRRFMRVKARRGPVARKGDAVRRLDLVRRGQEEWMRTRGK